MQILETKEVKKYYQTPSGIVRALDGVSLSVTEGTFGAIVGSSGSGKTTLLHMLGGLDEPTGGEVWVRGTSLKEMSGEEEISDLFFRIIILCRHSASGKILRCRYCWTGCRSIGNS